MQYYGSSPLRVACLTAVSLIAFAANSILCRLALGSASIDAASFSTIRLLSGALVLMLLTRLAGRHTLETQGSWRSGAALALYAVTFSCAYVLLGTGTGALILFGAVQATMIISGLVSGERPTSLEWLGLLIAVAGLVYLVFPGVSSPSPSGAVLMTAAGIFWGIYSLRGRGAENPVRITTGNFIRSVPFVLAGSAVMFPMLHLTPKGVLIASLSGGVASGLGYVVWYTALRGITATLAATVQLAVPLLAAAGGVLFLAETVSIRLVLSGLAILGGVGLAIIGRTRSS
ncbi:MAG: EamA family transporter [Geobacter sp.]|nr:EamA family transporter [Geobacter sp.]